MSDVNRIRISDAARMFHPDTTFMVLDFEHDRVVAEMNKGNWEMNARLERASETIASQAAEIAELKAKLESLPANFFEAASEIATARAQIAKLREQRNHYINLAFNTDDREFLERYEADTDAEVAALEGK